MEKIYKYPLALEDKQTIEMPIGSQILCVQTQFNQPLHLGHGQSQFASNWGKDRNLRDS